MTAGPDADPGPRVPVEKQVPRGNHKNPDAGHDLMKGDGCCVTNTTASLVAQGTVGGLLLAALVWVGVGLVGFIVLTILMWILFLLCCCTCNGDCTCSGVYCGDCGCGDCGGCDCDCGPGCDCGGGGCAPGCDCGGSGCDCGGGGGGGGGDCGCVVPPVMGVAVPVSYVQKRTRSVPLRDLSHHPDLPEYAQDVYRVLGHRLCIGCFTTLPIFMILSAYLFLAQPDLQWIPLVGTGYLLASFQVVSSLGRARTRRSKAIVKAALGTGLALVVYGVLISPLLPIAQFTIFGVTLLLAKLSALPRAARMRRAGHHACKSQTEGP
jgi:hypothetical protein